MSILSVRMDPDDEAKLEAVLAKTRTSKSSLIKQLISEKWLSMQAGKTFLQRRGGPPKYLLDGPPDLSDRPTRKRMIESHLEQRRRRRTSK